MEQYILGVGGRYIIFLQLVIDMFSDGYSLWLVQYILGAVVKYSTFLELVLGESMTW